MRILIIFFICFLFQFGATAQTNIKIILKTNLKIERADAFDISQAEYHDLNYKDTLTINFKKQNIDLYNIRYFVGGKMYRQQMWLDPGDIMIKAHTTASDLIIDTVINSPTYYDALNYLRVAGVSWKNKDTVAHNHFMLAEIKKHIEDPRSLAIAADYVNFNQNSKNDLLRLKVLLSSQKSDLRKFIFYQMSIGRMDKILSVKNIALPDFKFVDRKNNIVDMNLSKYNYIIIDFWFVACTPCREQHRVMKADYPKLQVKKIGLIGISTADKYDEWNSYLSSHGYNWENYLESGNNKLSNALSINACPHYLIVNNKGEIMGSYDSWQAVLADLRKLNLI